MTRDEDWVPDKYARMVAAWAKFVAAGGECFDWTPLDQKCPQCKAAAGIDTPEETT